jgi:hypothetical protein
MKMRPYCLFVLFFFLTGFNRIFLQQQEMSYYRPDIGLYINYDKKEGKKRIPFGKNWYFYFSLKSDSVALIQEIKNKVALAPKQYTVCLVKDSAFVKRSINGKQYKTEKFYFHRINM